MNAESPFRRFLARHAGPAALASLSIQLLVMVGCADRSTNLDEPHLAYLTLEASFSSSALQQVGSVDGWRVQVLRSGEGVIGEASGRVALGQETVEVPQIQVTLKTSCEVLLVRIELFSAGTVWWVAERELPVCAAEDNDVAVSDLEFDWTGPPQPGVSTGTLLFSVPQGEESRQTVTITYNAAGAVSWNVRIEEGSLGWLTIEPSSGTVTMENPQAFSVSVSAFGLEVGQYFANLVVGGFLGPPQVILVEMTVLEGPRIGLSPGELTFGTDKGTDPPPQSFSVANEGGGTLGWSVSEDAGWLTLNPTSGSLAGGESQGVTVAVAVEGLEAGEYQAGILVSASTDGVSSREIPVLLIVEEVFGSSITGTVSVDGSGVSGVTVTLAGTAARETTTAANGQYEFKDLRDGSYTVTISGYPEEVVFPTLSQGVSLGINDDQVLDFDGAYVGRGRIGGTVAVEGRPLSGVTVTLSGPNSGVTTTAGNGQYEFTGLRAGRYTVAISGVPAEVAFSAPTQEVSLGVDESRTVDFAGGYIRTSGIRGTVTSEGSGLVGVTVTANGPDGRVTTTTGSGGGYSFSGLRAGGYAVSISGYPPGVEFSTTTQDVSLGVGETKTVDFSGTPTPSLWVSANALAFTAAGSAQPGVETFQIRNAGGGTLTWGHTLWSSGGGCITSLLLSPSGGSLGAGESVSVTVEAQVSGCAVGWNPGGMGFTIVGSEGSSVPFDLTVLVVPSPAPVIFDDRYRRVCTNCCLSDPDGDWYKETIDYADLEGDVSPSTSYVYATWRFSDGTSGTYTYPPGSGFVTYSGNGFSGTVTTDPCYNFLDGLRSWVDITLQLRDAGGNRSNVISFRITP